MSERFEIHDRHSWLIRDNHKLPHMLDIERACIRLNEFDDKVTSLEADLKESEEKRSYASQIKENEELRDALIAANQHVIDLFLFLLQLRNSFHEGDETYIEIDDKLKELGDINNE